MRISRFVSVPLGGAEGLPDELVSTPMTSLITDKPAGRMRAPIRLRAAPDGSLCVLASDPAGAAEARSAAFLEYAADGTAGGRTPIPPVAEDAPGWHIVDFAAADGSLYLLETSAAAGSSLNHLRRLAGDGEVLWHRSGTVTAEGVELGRLDGAFERILVDRGSVAYLSGATRHGLVARVDPENGALEPYADWGSYRGSAFMDGAGVVYYVQYMPQTGARYWVRFDPAVEQISPVPVSDELFDFLARPVGVDDRGRAYGVSGTSMACMAEDGSAAWMFACEGLVPGRDGDVYLSSSSPEDGGRRRVDVEHRAPEGGPVERHTLALPPAVPRAARGLWRLIDVADGRYVLFGGETATEPGTLVVLSEQGEVSELVAPAPPDVRLTGYWAQPPASWSVALDGSVYVPVFGPEQLVVLRLTPDPVDAEQA